MTWIFEKFKGDMAIYATCPVCNFHHSCGDLTGYKGITKQYTYCPMCGEYLYNSDKEIEIIYNFSDLTALYEKELNWEVINKER